VRCDWQYEINLPLECFLNGSQPDAGWGPPVMWLGPVAFLAIGAIIDFIQKRRK